MVPSAESGPDAESTAGVADADAHPPLSVGVAGCGTIAQVMHLPHLAAHPGAELAALSEPAAGRRATVGDRYGVPGDDRYAEGTAMVEAAGARLDAVLVLTPMQHHADAAVAALEADIGTFVEKPLAADVADADRMVAAAEASPAPATVGYMKRYAPAYERAREAVADLGTVDLVTAYDVDPDHGRVIQEAHGDAVVGGAPPAAVRERSAEKRVDDATAAVGERALAGDYCWHLEHACHDANLLRGLFGSVERIDHADLFADGRFATAHLVYDDGVRCTLESGDSERHAFEQFLRVDAPTTTVTLEYSNPFVPNTPARVTTTGGELGFGETRYRGSYEEPFERELHRFLGRVRGDRSAGPRDTGFGAAREDVRLIADLFRTSAGIGRLGSYDD